MQETASTSSLTLVLGGARSGKSAWAEALVERLSPQRIYVATGEARDAEMADRITAHRDRRGRGWRTIEAPRAEGRDVAGAGAEGAVLFDCLTLWLSNAMEAGVDWRAEAEALIAAMATSAVPVVAVSNEIGLGLVPETPLGRAFRDAQGALNQMVAEHADRVVFVAAGCPLALKGALP